MRVAVATCNRIPEPDVDEGMLLDALRTVGLETRTLAWDQPGAPFSAHDLVLIRSTWNYYEDLDGFLAWVEETAKTTQLLNPAAVVRSNARKTYLADLAARGIDIVPTEFIAKGEALAFEDIAERRGWKDVVIKPVVSAGSFQTRRFGPMEVSAASAFLRELVTNRDAMVQPWMPSVETYGERSLIWIDGELTHAIRKSPRFADGVESVSDEVPIAPEERAFATRVLAPLEDQLLYARVDIVRDPEGVLRVMELELIEPSLFFKQCPRALERFVAAVARHASRAR